MSGLNKVFLIGRLGRDPEDRVTPGGTKVSNFSLATNQYRNTEGGTEKRTEWHRIVAFGKTADNCAQFLHKGSLVCVEGSLQTRSWEKPPGEKHFMTEIVAFRISFLESKGGTSGRNNNSNNDEGDEDAEGQSF